MRYRKTDIPNPLLADDPYRAICAYWFARLLSKTPLHHAVIDNIFDDADCRMLLNITLSESDSEDSDEDSDNDYQESPLKKSRKRGLKYYLRPILARTPPSMAETPLGKNIAMLGETLELNSAEAQIMAFAVLIGDHYGLLSQVLSSLCDQMNAQQVQKLMTGLLDLPKEDISKALKPDSTLATSGLLRLNSGKNMFDNLFAMPDEFSEIMFSAHASQSELLEKFLKHTSPAKLGELDFAHLTGHISVLRTYLANALAAGETGVNILLYGKPGIGKTELAKLLAQDTHCALYEVRYDDQDGDAVNGQGRLASYMLCQRLLSKDKASLILFDEIEDVFPTGMGGMMAMLFGEKQKNAAGKAWINRTLENNPVPAIWIANHITQIDPAYLRRFDYMLEMPHPPKAVRRRIVDKYLGELNFGGSNLDSQFVARLADCKDLSPAQLEKAARVTRLSQPQTAAAAQAITEQVLRGSATAMDFVLPPLKTSCATPYNLGYLNTNLDTQLVIASLKLRPRGTFLFHGAPGTGKTALARHLADAIDKPLMLRRASDLLSMWVGGSEQNIAAMFREASDENAILLLDEADGLLADRRGARQSWEVTQVNEMLTHMEDFQGIFICTTNLLDRLDAASLRRFAFKVLFDYLHPDQRREFFLSFWKTLNPDATALESQDSKRLERMDSLTPGDFAAVARRLEIIGTVPKADDLLTALEEECRVKGISTQPMGFLA